MSSKRYQQINNFIKGRWYRPTSKAIGNGSYDVCNLFDLFNHMTTLLNGIHLIIHDKKNTPIRELFNSMTSPSFEIYNFKPNIINLDSMRLNEMIDTLILENKGGISRLVLLGNFVKTSVVRIGNIRPDDSDDIEDEIDKILDSLMSDKKLFNDEAYRIDKIISERYH